MNDTQVIDPASWNLYVYVRNNPLMYLDPTGMEYVNSNCKKGTNECETVNYEKDSNGKIKYAGGGEETKDLKKLVMAINASGSKTAIERFFALRDSKTKVTISITDVIDKKGTDAETFAHDKKGNRLNMNKSERNKAAFLDNGEYEAVTIAISENKMNEAVEGQRKDEPDWTVGDELTVCFGHESVHVTDQASRDAVRNRASNKTITPIFHPPPLNRERDQYGYFKNYPKGSPNQVAIAIRMEIYAIR